MKIETNPRDEHQVQIVAEFDAETLEKFKHRAARKIATEAKIPGFRPGKAPYDVIRRFAGEKTIVNEAMELLVDEVYPDVIKEANVKPYGPGELENIISVEPPKLSFVVPLEPEITLGDYRSVRLDYSPQPFDEKEVDRFFYQIQTNYATVEPADDRPAQENDVVFLTYNGALTHPAEGEDPIVINETPFQQLIKPEDQPQENELPFPGFGRLLIGAKAEEERDFVYTYPEDATLEKAKGKEVNFHTKVQSVKTLVLPELNDEFAQTAGNYPSFETMKETIRTRLEANSHEEYDQKYFTEIIDHIHEQSTLKYPPQALKEEIEEVLRSIEQDLSNQKLDLDTYLKIRKTDKDAFIETEVKPTAVKRLERSLIIDEVSKAENIKVDQQQLESGFNTTLSELNASGELPKLRRRIGDEKLANVIAMQTASRLINSQVLTRLKDIATGKSIEIAPEAPATIEQSTAEPENSAVIVETKENADESPVVGELKE